MLCVGLISNPLVYDKNEVVLKSEVVLMRERWLSGRHRVTRCRRPALGGLPARMRKDRARARGCEERRGGGGGRPVWAGRAAPCSRRRSPEEEPLPSAPRRPPLPRLSPSPACGGGRGGPPTKSGLRAASSPRPGRRRGQAGTGLQCALSSLACCEAASCTLLAYEITDSRSEPALTKRLAKTISGSEHNFSPVKTKQ